MQTHGGAHHRLRRAAATLAASVLIGGCGSTPPASSPGATATPTPDPASIGPTDPAATAPPGTPIPRPSSGRFSATLSVAGDVEIVYDWSDRTCGTEVIPDLGAHAYRDASGTTHLLLSWVQSYRMSGPSLDAVVVGCETIGTSTHAANPGRFADNEWVVAPYTLDGETVYALVHNEYQGHTHADRCPSGDYFDCWDNSITMAISTDGGASFRHIVDPPGHLVATAPAVYAPDNGPSGYRGPSNIIRGADGLFYAYFNVSEPVTLKQWVCVMRTDDLSSPGAWRYYDGSAWAAFIDPYRQDPAGAKPCPPLDQDDIGHALNESITWNTVLERYVLVGLSADQIGGREVWGVYYAFSTDLVEWSRRQILMEIPLPWTVGDAGRDLSYLYPTLLDPDSESANYETTDAEAFLYLTRNNHGHGSLDRDLVRYPVRFTIY